MPVLVVVSAMACAPVERGLTADQKRHVIETGEAAAAQLRERLAVRLTTVIQADGPAAAVDVCATEALVLTREITQNFTDGLELKRTSSRVRNPRNAPDSLEQEALTWFEGEIAAGRAVPTHFLQAESDGYHRYYAPLRVVTLCIQCHGPPDRLDPDVRRVLAERYPQDRATGYVEGDFRGLIRVRVPLPDTAASR